MSLKNEIPEIITSSSEIISNIKKNSYEIESAILKIISTIKNGNKIAILTKNHPNKSSNTPEKRLADATAAKMIKSFTA